VCYAFLSEMPTYNESTVIPIEQFGTKRALNHLKVIANQPHYCGTTAHTEVRNYIINELEKLGLEVSVQEQEAVNSKWQGGVKTFNILTRIKGTADTKKALLLLSHYDSTPHSSFGGSDAGSGVVTIMETIRAYISSGQQSKNDIIILISDAEELGLLGAKAFVTHHPWAKDVGLVLNLEARGSGGPSYMLLETNGGNHNFIKAFHEANTPYPVGNSLMYSIYKMLPNDTDLTIFRENGNIDGFNFAFIDDFYDYHTALDTWERLDPETLTHQGSYFVALLHYFGNADLAELKGVQDDVFFNFPGFGVVYYPFSAVLPTIIVISLLFVVLFIFGIRKKRISLKKSITGIVPFLSAIVSSAVIGVFGWQVILFFFPQYRDILHGFPYNGYYYVIMFISLTLGVLFYIYSKFCKKTSLANKLVAPILFWILVNFVIAFTLKGGGFMILPLISLIISWGILIFTNDTPKIRLFLFTLLSLPTLIIFSPLIAMFPVGLGLKMIVVSLVVLVLIFGSMLAVFGNYSRNKHLAKLFFAVALLSFVAAYFKSDYTEDSKQPTGIVFIQDIDNNEAFFASFNKKNDDFTKQFLGENPQEGDLGMPFTSKFETALHLYNKTSLKDISIALVNKQINDTLYADKDVYEYRITSQRKTNLFYITSNDSIAFYSISFNGEKMHQVTDDKNSAYSYTTTKDNKKIISYYLADGSDELIMRFEVAKGVIPNLELLDISFDLMKHPQFKVTPRDNTMMPTPFVINDAVILKKRI